MADLIDIKRFEGIERNDFGQPLLDDSVLKVDDSIEIPRTGGGGVPSKQEEEQPNKIDVINFDIKSNVKSANILLNGVDNAKKTNSILKLRQSEIFQKGEVEIEVYKEGYETLESYLISVEPQTLSERRETEPTLYIDPQNPDSVIGLNNFVTILTKFRGDEVISSEVLKGGILKSLEFELNEIEEIVEDLNSTLRVNLIGDSNSVSIVSGNKNIKAKVGRNNIDVKNGETYFIRTSNISKYRISEIKLISSGQTQTLKASKGESLSTEINIDGDTQIDIITKEVVIDVKIKPSIKIKNGETLNYNINKKTGVPIVIEKNRAVDAISVIVGDNIFEFDEINKEDDEIVITIPSNAFKSIAKYNVKIIPYSISEVKNRKPKVKPVSDIIKKEVSTIPDKPKPIEDKKQLPTISLSDRPRQPKVTIVEEDFDLEGRRREDLRDRL